MKKTIMYLSLSVMIFMAGCTSESVDYSKSLFRHIPDDPDVLVLVKPNDLAQLAEVAVNQLPLADFLEGFSIDATDVKTYQTIAVNALEAIGVPWTEVQSIGFLLYYGKPVILVSGTFSKVAVSEKMTAIGFKQFPNGYFEYLYNDWKMNIPEDGLMMFAVEDMLNDLAAVPEENRLWNREDFKEYRSRSPLDNSVFVWAHPSPKLLSDFKYREVLGDVSLALDFSGNLTMKAIIRIKDPEKTVYLHDIMLGSIMTAGGFFGDDPDYGPMFKAVKVTHDNKQVETSLVLSANQLLNLKTRLKDDFKNPESKTMNKLKSVADIFR